MALSQDQLLELGRTLPHRPGVYLMKDSRSKVIYVGKAKDLKRRVLSYFQDGREEGAKLRALVRRVSGVDFLVVDSEKEALILEATLIKRHRPRYNVALRDDKAYPYIRLTTGVEFPQLSIIRRPRKDGHRYFGPYASAGAARATLSLLNRILPLRKCKGERPPLRSRPCLEYQLGHCLAPCTREVDPDIYLTCVREAELFLSGRLADVSRRLEEAMWRASQEERFEEAAAFRDKLKAVAKTLERQVMVSSQDLDRDVFGLASGPTGLAVVVLFVRAGALVGSRSFFIKGAEADGEVLAQTVGQFYTGKPAFPDQVLLPAPCQDQDLLAEWLSEMKGARVRITVPQRGQGRDLIQRARANAESALPVLAGSPEAQAAAALEELGRKLGLEGPPLSLEGYDISNLQQGHPVGAMVRFEEGRPARGKYRNYAIRTVEGQDDYAMLAEVLSRRFSGPDHRGGGKGLEPPDLIVIDGGKGQLSAAGAALEGIGLGGQPLAALAKTPGSPDQDRLFVPGRKNPVPLSKPARLLLMNLRDETHRRAVGAHRRSRSGALTRSRLMEIEGIGPQRAQILLRHLGSLKAVAAAGVEELARVPGFSNHLAEKIHSALHPLVRPTVPKEIDTPPGGNVKSGPS